MSAGESVRGEGNEGGGEEAMTCTRARSWSASMSTVFMLKRLSQTSKRSSRLLPSRSMTSIRDISSSPVPLSLGNPESPANCR